MEVEPPPQIAEVQISSEVSDIKSDMGEQEEQDMQDGAMWGREKRPIALAENEKGEQEQGRIEKQEKNDGELG